MSNPYDPAESDLRKQLTEARLALHHERARRESCEHEIRALTSKVDWLRKAEKLLIWNGQQWQVRHQSPQTPLPKSTESE